MRVLMISAAYPPDRCGVGDYSRRLARELAARCELELAVLVAARDAAAEEGGPVLLKARGDVVLFSDVRRAARQFGPDLIHLQLPTRRAVHPLAAFFARRLLGLPVVETWHEHVAALHWTDWLRVPALSGLVHVRQDLPERLHPRIQSLLRRTPTQFIKGERTVPALVLSDAERSAARRRIAGEAALVAFFGFVYPNKGVELMFDIADPGRHHLLIIGDLDPADAYQRRVAALAASPRWRGRATVTGFVDAQEAGRLLAAADAVVFPFLGGAGPWSSSMNAALAAGTLVVATTVDKAQLGRDEARNLCLATPGDVAAMRAALERHIGARRPAATGDAWGRVAEAHERFYRRLV